MFLVVGLMIHFKIRKYFPQFFLQNRCVTLIATISLTFSTASRGIIDLAGLTGALDNFYEEHPALYNGFFLIFGDLVPIGFQLSTLVFGYIRRKNNSKMRLEVRAAKDYGQNYEDVDMGSSLIDSRLSS